MNAITETVDKPDGVCQQAGIELPHTYRGEMGCLRNEAPWFCVRTLPQREPRAFNEISALGFKAFFPRIARRVVRYGRDLKVILPLFPTYVLVSLEPDDDWGAIHRLEGRNRMLTGPSGLPVQLRSGEIERVMASGRAGDGVIDDEAPAFAPITTGTTVRITGGPMTDWSGVCAWSTEMRIGVLMTMFNAERVVPMDRASVEVV